MSLVPDTQEEELDMLRSVNLALIAKLRELQPDVDYHSLYTVEPWVESSWESSDTWNSSDC